MSRKVGENIYHIDQLTIGDLMLLLRSHAGDFFFGSLYSKKCGVGWGSDITWLAHTRIPYTQHMSIICKVSWYCTVVRGKTFSES